MLKSLSFPSGNVLITSENAGPDKSDVKATNDAFRKKRLLQMWLYNDLVQKLMILLQG
jgi:hypothetical protein